MINAFESHAPLAVTPLSTKLTSPLDRGDEGYTVNKVFPAAPKLGEVSGARLTEGFLKLIKEFFQ